MTLFFSVWHQQHHEQHVLSNFQSYLLQVSLRSFAFFPPILVYEHMLLPTHHMHNLPEAGDSYIFNRQCRGQPLSGSTTVARHFSTILQVDTLALNSCHGKLPHIKLCRTANEQHDLIIQNQDSRSSSCQRCEEGWRRASSCSFYPLNFTLSVSDCCFRRQRQVVYFVHDVT